MEMTELERALYEMMPDHLSQDKKVEWARSIASSTIEEAERQSVLTGLDRELIIQASIQVIAMQMKKQQTIH